MSTVRWIARIGSLATLGLLLVVMIGEGFDPLQMRL